MQLKDFLHQNQRVVECNATSGALAQGFLAAGYSQYLVVTRDLNRQRAIVRDNAALLDRIAVCSSAKVVRHNNADLLILNGRSAIHLANFRTVRHARFVALPLSVVPWIWYAVIFSLIQWLLGRLGRPRIVHSLRGTGAPRLIMFPVRRRKPYDGARRFIPHRLGVERFLGALESRGIRHAVLRWFEDLPHVAPGEDIDLLVDDAGLETAREMLSPGPGIQPIDLYSVTGLPGADFRSMPYFPPYLAQEILDKAIMKNGLCRVPAPREHFLSLAYHALYHKGRDSGVPHRESKKSSSTFADHDYPAVLRRLAEHAGIDVAITLNDLDAYLDSQSWRPPHDMLVRLSRRTRWIRSLLPKPTQTGSAEDQLAVFLLRREALNRGGTERAVKLIENYGFQVVVTRSFNARDEEMIARTVRGGNWGRGPWPISGGPPVAAIVVHDPAPLAVSRKQRRRFPFLANARLLCKEKIRDAFNDGLPADQHCNVVHSSDNGREAMDYLRIVAPDAVESAESAIRSSQPLHRRQAA